MLQSLVIPALGTLQHELHTTQSTATWVLTAYLLSSSIFAPIMGRIGDMIGKERVLVTALVFMATGSLLGALAPSIGVMIAARVIQGISGGVLPLGFGIIRDEFPKTNVAGAVGALNALGTGAAGLGLVLAGPIQDLLGYRWLFWLPMILAIIAAGLVMLFVPESPVRSPGRISVLPAIFLGGWLLAFLVALSEAPKLGWSSGKILGLVATAVVLAVGWVASEKRAATPLIDMNMMRRRAVWTNNLVALLAGVAMFGMAFLPQFVQTPKHAGYGFGASVSASGLMLVPWNVASFAVGMSSGRLARKVSGKLRVIVGCVIGSAAMAFLAFEHEHQWQIYATTAVMGAGLGMINAAVAALIVAGVPPAQTGAASGMNANIRTIGGSFGTAMMATIVSSRLRSDGLPEEAGYTAGFAMLAAALGLAALAGLLIPVLKRPASTADESIAIGASTPVL